MDQQGPAVAIARLRAAWDAQVKPSTRRALVALVFAVFFAGAHLARLGNPVPRAATAGAIGLTLLGLAVRALVVRRRRADPRRVVRDTVARMDRQLGEATLRALTLIERTARDERAGSSELAGLHLQRLLARTSLERLGARAARAAVRWSSVGLGLAALGAVLVFFEPFRIIEGVDVLAASKGDAPLRLGWVDEVVMGAAPPEYLHQQSSDVRPFHPTLQPRGTTLTVRGRPLHPGRPVVLTDGTTAVPFLDDGAGHLVARWTVADSTTLSIAAEFGDPPRGGVRIRQPDEQPVVSIPDEAPRVTVEGAPRTVKLLDEPSIPIHYEATDDHGLREVDLVLRAGAKEERRVLSHPAADVLADRGGYEIQARDPFFKKVYVPVEITVEARDNDVVSGPKWGKSPAIVVIPPQVGEPEALRYEALIRARDAVTDLTAFRIGEKAPAAKDAREHLAREAEAQATALRAVSEALAGSYGGLEVRGRTVALARGQLRRLGRALDAEKKSLVAAKHQKLLDETEDALLAFDAGLRGPRLPRHPVGRQAPRGRRRRGRHRDPRRRPRRGPRPARGAPSRAGSTPRSRCSTGAASRCSRSATSASISARSSPTTCAAWPGPGRPAICTTPSWRPAIWPRASAGRSRRSAAGAGTGEAEGGEGASSPGAPPAPTRASPRPPTRRPPKASASWRSWPASTPARSATSKTRWSAPSPPRSWISSSRRPSSTPRPSARP